MAEGVIVMDKDGHIKSINPAAVQIMGADPEHLGGDFFEITGQLPFYNADGVNIPAELRPALATLRTGVPFFNQIFGFDRMGTDRIWLMSSCRLLNPDLPGQSDMVMSFTDVTNERAIAEKVMFYASHDALTELPNRASVRRKIDKALATPDPAKQLRAVLFIDIDDLKTVNDTLGHTAGDELLRSTAGYLRHVVAHGDVAGRLGGDEFVVLVCRDVSRRNLDEMVERLRTEFATPAAIGATATAIRASIGVVEVDRDEQRTADEILRDADFAMYEAKRARRGQDSSASSRPKWPPVGRLSHRFLHHGCEYRGDRLDVGGDRFEEPGALFRRRGPVLGEGRRGGRTCGVHVGRVAVGVGGLELLA
jgi:diguanylate cyclase (GGDEF)-like protein